MALYTIHIPHLPYNYTPGNIYFNTFFAEKKELKSDVITLGYHNFQSLPCIHLLTFYYIVMCMW